MWIFLNNAMLSAIKHPTDAKLLIVRARAKGDLERVFGQRVKVRRSPERDYAYRTVVTRHALRSAMANQIDAIDYGNFKGSVKQRDRHDAYLHVWRAMMDFQQRREPDTGYGGYIEKPPRTTTTLGDLFPDSL